MYIMEIIQQPSPQRFDGNYFYVLHHQGKTIAIDPGCADTFQRILEEKNYNLDAIWVTHHHWDHTDGIKNLVSRYNCPVYAPSADYGSKDIACVTHYLKEGDSVTIGDLTAKILFFPGHTLDHIAYYFKKENILFSGDVLFGMGCGRVFEGTMPQTWQSLQKLAQLPDVTKVYCAHEYTKTNAEFCYDYLKDDPAFMEYYRTIKQLRAKQLPTVPLNLGKQKEINPFLSHDQKRFIELRTARNTF